MAVAEGKPFLGMNTQKGNVVYFALEDSDKFAQERLNIATKNQLAPEGFYYIYEDVPTLDDGLLEYLNQLYEQLGDIRLIVIDTLAKVEYQAKRGETAYHRDYRTGTAFKKWADDKGVSIILVTHTTKMEHSDVFQNTMGTNGVTGACDAIITLTKKKRSDKNAVLSVTGRRVREKYLKVTFNNDCIWQFECETSADQMEQEEKELERSKEMEIFKSSKIREGVLKIADSGYTENMRASAIRERANDLGVPIVETPKEIGGFLNEYQVYFNTVDNLKVSIIKNGNGPRWYRFEYYQLPGAVDAMPDEIPFD